MEEFINAFNCFIKGHKTKDTVNNFIVATHITIPDKQIKAYSNILYEVYVVDSLNSALKINKKLLFSITYYGINTSDTKEEKYMTKVNKYFIADFINFIYNNPIKIKEILNGEYIESSN